MLLDPLFVCHPTVCPVGNRYQILIPVTCDVLLSVRVGDHEYYNHSNGIRITGSRMQRVSVPMTELDKAKAYTVICQPMLDRKPYFPVSGERSEVTYPFFPVEKTDNIILYQIADAHGLIEPTVGAALKYHNRPDLLILNGDIANSSATPDEIMTIYKIASGVTGGEIPCVISRGNHDLRGQAAETLADYIPNDNGHSYYTFRVGCVWGILVDCGEDKEDRHEEYGSCVCCHQFRLEQTDFIRDVIRRKDSEYAADGVKYRLVVSHVPFTHNSPPPFGVENAIYTTWCQLLREDIKPDLMLTGHMHILAVSEVGGDYDDKGQPCPVIIGSEVNFHLDENGRYCGTYTGLGVTLHEGYADIVFNDKDNRWESHTVPYQN